MSDTVRAKTLADLIDKVYRREGWTKVEGENRAKRVTALYNVHVLWRSGVCIAIRKCD